MVSCVLPPSPIRRRPGVPNSKILIKVSRTLKIVLTEHTAVCAYVLIHLHIWRKSLKPFPEVPAATASLDITQPAFWIEFR